MHRQSFNPYLLTPLQRRRADFEAEELLSNYADKVTLKLRLPQEQLTAFEKMFTDLTAGGGTWGALKLKVFGDIHDK